MILDHRGNPIRRESTQGQFARQTTDKNPPIGRLSVFLNADGTNLNTERSFKTITERDLYEMDISALLATVCRSNGTAARLLDDLVTFGTLGFELRCADARGQRMLDDFLTLLDNKRNDFGFSLRQLFSQIALRGNVAFEVVVDDERQLSNFFAVDPDLLHWRETADPIDGIRYELFQFDAEGEPILIDSPLVHFSAINALPGDRKGAAVIGPAMPSIIGNMLISKDLREVISTHAYPERYWHLDLDEYVKREDYSADDIAELAERQQSEMATVAGNRDKSKIAVVQNAQLRYGTAETQHGGLNFVDPVSRINDRESLRGGMSNPYNLGISEYQAESAARTFSQTQAVRTRSYQNDVQDPVSDKLTLVLQGNGISAAAELVLQENSSELLRVQAEVYKLVGEAIKTFVESGVSVQSAIDIINEAAELELEVEEAVVTDVQPSSDESSEM